MQRPPTRYCLSALLVIVAGCTGGGAIWDLEGSGTPTPRADCVYRDDGDPNVPECLITERPADLRLENAASESHNVTVDVVRNDSTVVLSETVSFEPGVNYWHVFEDVFDRPGSYTMTASVDDSTDESAKWTVGERYTGDGDVEWTIVIRGPDELAIERDADF